MGVRVVYAPGVTLTPDRSAGAAPGAVVAYEHTLANTGNAPDTFDISHTSSQVWDVDYPEGITLDAGQATTLVVSVTVPAEAVDGTVDVTTLSATSQADTGVSASVADTTTVVLGEWKVYLPMAIRDH